MSHSHRKMTGKLKLAAVLAVGTMTLAIGVLVPAAHAGSSSIIDAKAWVDCDGASLGFRGELPPGSRGAVDYTLALRDSKRGDKILVEGSVEVTANDRGFYEATVEEDLELLGWYDLRGRATLRGYNTVDIEIVVPKSGKLDCCDAVLGNFVWQDENRDGLQDDGEPGLADVQLVLTRIDGQVKEQVTDAQGGYLFEGLCPLKYEVDVDESTLPADLSPTEPNVGDDPAIDSDGPLDGGPVPVRIIGIEDLTIDFGYVVDCRGRLGDFVWTDTNQNGVQDADEPGIPGVVVELLDDAGDPLDSTTTDAQGLYEFDGPCAGRYQVRVAVDTLPAGLAPTLVNVGDDAWDSDPNPVSTTLEDDASEDLTLDFGYGDCLECKGGTLAMSLRYDGEVAAFVEVVESDDDVLFAAELQPGETFTFEGLGGEKVKNDIDLFLDGVEDVRIHTSCSKPLGPGLVFGSFTVVSVLSDDNGLVCPLVPCAVTGLGSLDFGSKDVKWRLTNVGDGFIQVSRIVVTWPKENGGLVKIKLGGDEIYKILTPPPSADISSDWEGDEGRREIEPGKEEELKFEFESEVSTDASGYSIRVEFVEGCALDFEPGAGGSFECSKPIDALTMIWDGTQSIRVQAWKGDPGTELLADVDDVMVGQEVAVSGFAGSPNDVVWEIFEPGTLDELGESEFHLSCSDSEMDGAEDCGSRQGNGKSNDELLVNDWILEGIVDSDETLDCTP